MRYLKYFNGRCKLEIAMTNRSLFYVCKQDEVVTYELKGKP